MTDNIFETGFQPEAVPPQETTPRAIIDGYIQQLGIQDAKEISALHHEAESQLSYGLPVQIAFYNAFKHVEMFLAEGEQNEPAKHFVEADQPGLYVEVWHDARHEKGIEYSASEQIGQELHVDEHLENVQKKHALSYVLTRRQGESAVSLDFRAIRPERKKSTDFIAPKEWKFIQPTARFIPHTETRYIS